VAILAGSLLALVAARIIADIAPFRVRPMFDLRLEHHAYSFPVSPKLVHWSSFPSDNATFFFGLAFGLAYLWRRLAVPAMLYTAVWVCLPRTFLGVHWASDVAVGAMVGIALVWVCLKVEWFQARLRGRVVSLVDAKPEAFYAIAFLALFEMAILFDDVRGAGSDLAHFLRASPPRDVEILGLVGLAALCLVALTALFLSVIHRRTGPPGGNRVDPTGLDAMPANRKTALNQRSRCRKTDCRCRASPRSPSAGNSGRRSLIPIEWQPVSWRSAECSKCAPEVSYATGRHR
jgi:undecaprenyl-diphosphatase